MFPITNRHGMTIGELALLFKHEFGYDCKLTSIEMEGWKRNYYFDDTNLHWISPSPNTTDLDMMILYPGTCLDRKSTRLNSSHVAISYAVCCLKRKRHNNSEKRS